MIIKGDSNSVGTASNLKHDPYSVNATDQSFITLIQNRITGYGQIPYTVPINLIIDVIKSSAKWFYQWYPPACQHSFYGIRTSDIESIKGYNEFNRNVITVDKRIRAILSAKEASPYWAKRNDFNIFNIQSTISGGYIQINGSGIDNNMFLIENAVKMVEISALTQMFKNTVSARFNPLTHEINFKKKLEASAVVLEVLKCVDVAHLYQDNFFERHVIANTKRELKRIIGGHTINLPGGATLNVDEICNNIEDADNVEEKIKGMNSMGDIISQRS